MKKRILISLTTVLWIVSWGYADNVLVTNDGNHPVPITGSVNTTIDLSHVISPPGTTPSPSPAKAMVVQGIAGGKPLATADVTVGGTQLAQNFSASHITTKTTTTVTSATAYVSSVAICVTNAGTTQTLVIQNKEGTPKVLYTAGAAIVVGNAYIWFPVPILMTSGIDIITGGTTAGTQDIFISYWQ